MLSIGIDVGGTFTDIVVVDEGREVHMLKVPSTPHDPQEGIENGLDAAAKALGRKREELVGRIERLVHGTTVATNTMLQYSGARTALLTTWGFRDSLEMRRCHRRGQWNFFTPQPALIVPRYLRRGMRERTLWDGSINQPLREDHLLEEVGRLVDEEGVESIAICFLFSFKNPENERQAAGLIRSRYPEVFVSASSEVAPQIREYERSCTTVVNCFVSPKLSRYLNRLASYLHAEGMKRAYQVLQSNGGITTASAAGRNGVRALLSGPAGGAIGGVSLAERLKEPNLIVTDMGGTSFDVTLIQDGQISLVNEGEIAGYKISLPMIEIHTVGAGGGSIAWVDAGEMLKVGPRSAGAEPGPACYSRGGTEPTVTDADLALGLLNPDYFLGGRIRLRADLAARTIAKRVGERLGLTTAEAAQAIFEIVNANMVDAIHVLTVGKGNDPRQFALVAAGGAGPVHAGMLARALGIRRVIVPPASEVFCALGALEADVKYDFVRTCLLKTSTLKMAELLDALAELRGQGTAQLEQDRVPPELRRFEYTLEMRYIGQHWQIPVPFSLDGSAPGRVEEILEAFHRRHETIHGYKLEGREAEIVNIGLMAVGQSPKVRLNQEPLWGKDASAGLKGEREAFLGEGFGQVPVYDAARLRPGNELAGPAIIERPNTTIVVYPEMDARMDAHGNLILELR